MLVISTNIFNKQAIQSCCRLPKNSKFIEKIKKLDFQLWGDKGGDKGTVLLSYFEFNNKLKIRQKNRPLVTKSSMIPYALIAQRNLAERARLLI